MVVVYFLTHDDTFHEDQTFRVYWPSKRQRTHNAALNTRAIAQTLYLTSFYGSLYVQVYLLI